MEITDDIFDKLISQAMDELPQEYIARLQNVAITYEDAPTPEQLQKQGLSHGQTLLGLYEGIALTRRGDSYGGVLPDKITLFKLPIVHSVHDLDGLKVQIKHTLWHEIAHYFGLDHDRIHEIEARWR